LSRRSMVILAPCTISMTSRPTPILQPLRTQAKPQKQRGPPSRGGPPCRVQSRPNVSEQRSGRNRRGQT
jgi:hypothetical protein